MHLYTLDNELKIEVELPPEGGGGEEHCTRGRFGACGSFLFTNEGMKNQRASGEGPSMPPPLSHEGDGEQLSVLGGR